MTLQRSWVASANNADSPFPLNNLPYGVFSHNGGDQRLGVAIGDKILDVALVAGALPVEASVLTDARGWNGVMERGAQVWSDLRAALHELLQENATPNNDALVQQSSVQMHLPFAVSEYTDFYAGKHHATNVGTMFRGAENALPPNWLHMPIAYNGRASSVVVSGTDVRRPWGQLNGRNDVAPRWAPSERFDIELEMGAIVGSAFSGPVSIDEADKHIFGYVLLNDWSARDIQGWEYQPLGPFQAKATATTISPWIVTADALTPFRCATPERLEPLLPHLADTSPMLYDIDLHVTLNEHVIARTNYKEMYYSAAQQLAHHTTSGCPMRVGDLLGSGTISGPERHNRGSLLEICWGGREALELPDGSIRRFIEDGDRLGLHGVALGDGFQLGFGDCMGTVVAALDDPFATR